MKKWNGSKGAICWQDQCDRAHLSIEEDSVVRRNRTFQVSGIGVDANCEVRLAYGGPDQPVNSNKPEEL